MFFSCPLYNVGLSSYALLYFNQYIVNTTGRQLFKRVRHRLGAVSGFESKSKQVEKKERKQKEHRHTNKEMIP